jgi:regulator of PEP synthase PpsR (kinase-PPPase family)
VISDGIGQSASTILEACLIQFGCSAAMLHVFSRITEPKKILEILKKAKEKGVFVAYTIASTKNRELVHEICERDGLIHHDILGPPIEKLSAYLEIEPQENANLLRRVDSNYFKRIDAIEFTMKYDDGLNSEKVAEADIIILGLSRTSKTPTSYFLAQQGYKVVNIPIVPEVPIPQEIFSVDPNRVVCLVMDSEVLQKVRSARIRHYRTKSNYTDLERIFNEMELVYDLVKKNRKWHVVDTTNKSVEETAREITSMIFGK